MGRAGAMALFTADVPFRGRLRLDVVVDRMAAVAQGTGGTLHVIGWIESGPPIGAGSGIIRTPHLMRHVPLRREDVVIVATLGEVALLPDAAVGECDLIFGEGD